MCGSGRQLGAALTATRGQDGATGAGPHAGTEAVRAAAAPVTRLERALAHGTLPGALCRRTPSGARERPLTSATRLLYAAVQRRANRVQRRPWRGPSRPSARGLATSSNGRYDQQVDASRKPAVSYTHLRAHETVL